MQQDLFKSCFPATKGVLTGVKTVEYTKSLSPVTDEDIRSHVEGGVYLSLAPYESLTSTSWAALDFDDSSYEVVKASVQCYNLPLLVDETKSGKAHAYFFFHQKEDVRDVLLILKFVRYLLVYKKIELRPNRAISKEEIQNAESGKQSLMKAKTIGLPGYGKGVEFWGEVLEQAEQYRRSASWWYGFLMGLPFNRLATVRQVLMDSGAAENRNNTFFKCLANSSLPDDAFEDAVYQAVRIHWMGDKPSDSEISNLITNCRSERAKNESLSRRQEAEAKGRLSWEDVLSQVTRKDGDESHVVFELTHPSGRSAVLRVSLSQLYQIQKLKIKVSSALGDIISFPSDKEWPDLVEKYFTEPDEEEQLPFELTKAGIFFQRIKEQIDDRSTTMDTEEFVRRSRINYLCLRTGTVVLKLPDIEQHFLVMGTRVPLDQIVANLESLCILRSDLITRRSVEGVACWAVNASAVGFDIKERGNENQDNRTSGDGEDELHPKETGGNLEI